MKRGDVDRGASGGLRELNSTAILSEAAILPSDPAMSEFPHLPRAPIQEAIVDLRCTLPEDVDVQGFQHLKSKLGEAYDSVIPMRVVDTHVEVGKARAALAVENVDTPRGFAFRAQDPPRVAQYRADGFTYNWLRPYDTWQALRDEARRLWDLYVEAARPEGVTRMALRYVNRFPVQLPATLEDYLQTPPRLPESVPNQLHKFLFQWTLEDPDTRAHCQLTIASERRSPDAGDIILDIDSFRTEQYGPEDQAIWDRFEELRVLKNRIFFRSLTPRALDDFR